jgi:hypothetical protein
MLVQILFLVQKHLLVVVVAAVRVAQAQAVVLEVEVRIKEVVVQETHLQHLHHKEIMVEAARTMYQTVMLAAAVVVVQVQAVQLLPILTMVVLAVLEQHQVSLVHQ